MNTDTTTATTPSLGASSVRGAQTRVATGKRLLIAAIVTALTLIIDQITKQMARTSLSKFSEVQVLGDFFRLQHAENPGAFLSLGAQMNDHTRFGIFTVLVIIFLIWATVMLVRKVGESNWAYLFGWTFLIAGGIGNVIDRIAKGTVTDFLILGVGPVQTGVFNIADIAISGGILIVLFFAREGTSVKPKAAVV
jgi:signal peptidase II